MRPQEENMVWLWEGGAVPAPESRRRPARKSRAAGRWMVVLAVLLAGVLCGYAAVAAFEYWPDRWDGAAPAAGPLPPATPPVQEQEMQDAYAPPDAVAAPTAQENPADDGMMLEIQPILQKPELPNGCEATSLTMLLRAWGYAADKMDVAYNWLPREDFWQVDGVRHGPSPHTAYAGDPATRQGFYCFSGPVCAGANAYLAQQGAPLECLDVSGMGAEALDAWLARGCPVMLWVTLDYGSVPEYMNFTWRMADGTEYTPYRNVHCVVVVGAAGGQYTLCDPLQGLVSLPQGQLLESNRALGGYAAVIVPR